MSRKRLSFLDDCPDRNALPRARRFSFLNLLPRLTALVLFAASGAASAQVSGSVSLVSNYIYRGTSLSNGNPEAQLNLNADFDNGLFAGLFATPIDLPTTHGQAIAYGGYAQRLTSELNWEAGLSESAYTGGGSQDYTEAFAGLSSEHFSGRLYYSPDYLGQSAHSVYGELNLNLPLTSALRFVAHAGRLEVAQHGSDNHNDLRAGLAYHLGDWNLQWAVASVRDTTVRDEYYVQVTNHYSGVFDAAWNF